MPKRHEAKKRASVVASIGKFKKPTKVKRLRQELNDIKGLAMMCAEKVDS